MVAILDRSNFCHCDLSIRNEKKIFQTVWNKYKFNYIKPDFAFNYFSFIFATKSADRDNER